MGVLLVFLAPSGSGKSTAAKYLQDQYQAKILKLATPLYQMQANIYQQVQVPLLGQDGELLQFLGKKVHQLNPQYLFTEFKKVYNPQEFTVNDDCRPHNYDNLKTLGAVFVAIKSPYRSRDQDATAHNLKDSLEWSHPIPAHYTIANESTLESFYNNLDLLMEQLCLKKST
jgi:hypothetical protein